MIRFATAVVALLTAALPARAGSDFVPADQLEAAGLAKFWQLRLPLAAGQRLSDVYLVDDQLYACTQDGYVFVIHAYTGTLRWFTQITTGGYRLTRPVHIRDRVLFVTPMDVTQWDRITGEPVRRTVLRFPAGSPPVSDGVRYFVGGINRRLYAFVPDFDFELWKTTTIGQITARPVVRNGRLYFASEAGDVYGCVARNKRGLWVYRTEGPVVADLVIDDNGLYVASLDRSLYLLDPDTGGRRWRARFESPLREPPVVYPDVAYQYSFHDGLVAVNPGLILSDERFFWKLPEGRRLLTRDAHFCYIQSRDGRVLVVRRDTGQIERSIDTPGLSLGIPVTREVVLYLAAPDGRLFCARPVGTPPLSREQILAALRAGQKKKAGSKLPKSPVTTTSQPPLEPPVKTPPIGGKSRVTRQFTGGSQP